MLQQTDTARFEEKRYGAIEMAHFTVKMRSRPANRGSRACQWQ
jgi:hypothetical protein